MRDQIRYAVSASGTGNPVYRVHYEFESAGQAVEVLASLGVSGKPAGSLPVRYLSAWPGISSGPCATHQSQELRFPDIGHGSPRLSCLLVPHQGDHH